MIPKQVLLAAAIIFLAAFTSDADLIPSQRVSPDQIWPASSGKEPAVGWVTLTVVGEGAAKAVPLEMVLAIDSSASMRETDPADKRLDAARVFVMKMDPARDKVGLVSWNEGIDFSIPPTDDFAAILEAIGRVDSSGRGTNLDRGLKEAIDLLSADGYTAGRDGGARIVIILSDGDGDYTKSGRRGSQAGRAKDEGIVVYAVGLMLSDPAKDNLLDIAETTGGGYYEACDASALDSIYQAIGEEVINLAGREVEVRYALARELSPSDYSDPPSSEEVEADGRVLTWKAGDISAGEEWSTSFAVSSDRAGIFELGGAGSEVTYKLRSGFVEGVKIEGAFLDVAEFRSGAMTNLNLDFDLSGVREIVKPVQQVLEEGDSFILWRFSEPNSRCGRNWAYLSEDGRIVVASLRPFSLSTRDALIEDLQRVMEMMVAAGVDLNTYNRSRALNAAEFYASDAGIYHQISYSFGADFDLNLAVPDCTIEEARLAVTGREMDYFAGAADQEYYIDGEYVTGCHLHEFPWDGWCTAEDVDITDKILPGAHRISGRKVSDPHTVTIEAITADEPPKDFLLYSDDYRSVWTPATKNVLISPEQMLSVTSGTLG